ncbi:type VI secretion system lysozyme [Bordetella sp. H567]|uniref:type VI secretion system baseplate subunit TssE n=1 Tax=Bordetella sp. H567 TaxID=1697043 RepID=UPI00081C5ECB|nr:type VI secretion system baseplate subunit TssE [Bordetella sp. H567]AOB32511.1 type VI secretion system lysozyme [Bordetella sp. H567]
MPELTSRDRLQPALLDRLTDLAPDAAFEPRERRVVSMRQLRVSVLRDLTYLFNAVQARMGDLGAFSLAEASVLNYGLRGLTGKTLADIDAASVADEIARAIRRFEPRIGGHSLRVTPLDHSAETGGSVMAFLVEGELWAQPYPERLYFKTELDLEAGEARLIDGGEVAIA